jgi:hypothetical protein
VPRGSLVATSRAAPSAVSEMSAGTPTVDQSLRKEEA